MSRRVMPALLCLIISALLVAATGMLAQTHDAGFSIEQVMSPAFPYGLPRESATADRVVAGGCNICFNCCTCPALIGEGSTGNGLCCWIYGSGCSGSCLRSGWKVA